MVHDGSRLAMGGVVGTEATAEAEADVNVGWSLRRQRREEREKRLRERCSSVVGLKECTEAAGRSDPARSEAEPRRFSRPLFAGAPLLEEAGARVSDDFDRGELNLSVTER
jgi:hypothetical protein